MENFKVSLLVFGIILLLLGLVGKIKAKEIEVGTSSRIVRFVTTLIGTVLIVFSFNTEVPSVWISNFFNNDIESEHVQTISQDEDYLDEEEAHLEKEHIKAEQAARLEDKMAGDYLTKLILVVLKLHFTLL